MITVAERALDHIGRVEPAAEADFQQHHVGGWRENSTKGGRRFHLEHGDRRAVGRPLAFRQHGGELGIGDQSARRRERPVGSAR